MSGPSAALFWSERQIEIIVLSAIHYHLPFLQSYILLRILNLALSASLSTPLNLIINLSLDYLLFAGLTVLGFETELGWSLSWSPMCWTRS